MTTQPSAFAQATDPGDEVLDLDRERAVRQEASGRGLPIRLGGQEIAVLPPELPLDVFQPLVDLDVDLPLIFRMLMDAQNAQDEQTRANATSLVVDLLVANPNLPRDLIAAVKQIGRRLLGDSGYEAFIGWRPSREDVGLLAKTVFRRYGLTLGEVSGSSDSAESGGPTSSAISSGSTASTPEASGDAPESRAS